MCKHKNLNEEYQSIANGSTIAECKDCKEVILIYS